MRRIIELCVCLALCVASCAPASPPNSEPGSAHGTPLETAHGTPLGTAHGTPLGTAHGTSPIAPVPSVAGAASFPPPRATSAPVQANRASEQASSSPRVVTDSPSQRDLLGSESAILSARILTIQNPSLHPAEMQLKLRAPDGPFGELTRRGLARNVRNGALLVRLPNDYPISRDTVAARYRTCSYVVDCDSSAVKSLGEGVLPAKPSVSELVTLVGRRISVKSLARGFDVASEVAVSGEGDCSEHAVLLAALARHHRLAARVIFGLAVLVFDGRAPALVGHAWTEIHDGKRWLLADAALDGLEYQKIPGLLRLHYLPISVLEHEDVGFQAKLLGMPNAFNVLSAEAGF